MSEYEYGITGVNTQVRRPAYISAILRILADQSLSETLTHARLGRWSAQHAVGLDNTPRTTGIIPERTRGFTAAKRYLELAVGLRLVARIAGAFRVTRFGRVVLKSLPSEVPPRLGLSERERMLYLYFLLHEDEDRLLTVLDMLDGTEGVERPRTLKRMQSAFQHRYVERLDARSKFEGHSLAAAQGARDARQQVESTWRSPKRYAENIVPPRLHWLTDLGVARINTGSREYTSDLTSSGVTIRSRLPTYATGISRADPSWLSRSYFTSIAPTLIEGPGRVWSAVDVSERQELLGHVVGESFETLRPRGDPKVTLTPVLLHAATTLAVTYRVWTDLTTLQDALTSAGREERLPYRVRPSRRENEAYLIRAMEAKR